MNIIEVQRLLENGCTDLIYRGESTGIDLSAYEILYTTGGAGEVVVITVK